MHYKGESVSSSMLLGLLSWQKKTTDILQSMGKRLIAQILETQQNTALAGQIGTDFSALLPGGAGLLMSRLSSLLQGSQPLRHFICKP